MAIVAAAIIAPGCSAAGDLTGVGSGPQPGDAVSIHIRFSNTGAVTLGSAERALAQRTVRFGQSQTLTIS